MKWMKEPEIHANIRPSVLPHGPVGWLITTL